MVEKCSTGICNLEEMNPFWKKQENFIIFSGPGKNKRGVKPAQIKGVSRKKYGLHPLFVSVPSFRPTRMPTEANECQSNGSHAGCPFGTPH
jgi:hypothetical protein